MTDFHIKTMCILNNKKNHSQFHPKNRIYKKLANKWLTRATTTATTQSRYQQLLLQRLKGEQRDLRG